MELEIKYETEEVKKQALSKLMKELETGMNCAETYSEEEAKKILDLKNLS